MKKFFIILIISLSLSSCSSISEINERIKGDGVPYIPGV